jgi:S-adenosylmethionine-diacylgycerolhomoserine-N-methlytransferase
MSLSADLRTLRHLLLSPVRGGTHAERLESFYQKQAADYDGFRERLLHGRRELCDRLPLQPGAVWVDIGGGTAKNLEFAGERLRTLQQVYVVDLSPSLLEIARRRIADQGWTNVQTVQADALQYTPPQPPDVVTCSYSLTMIPDWFAVIDRALALLKPGGTFGVVDFYVGRKHPGAGAARHGWFTRTGWATWFAMDNVFLSPDHAPYLQTRFPGGELSEHRGRLPYVPFVRPPYYIFTGRKPVEPRRD